MKRSSSLPERPASYAALILAAAALCVAGCSKHPGSSTVFSVVKDPEAAAQLKQFVADKAAQANAASNEPAPGFAPFFADAAKGDWLAVSNDFIGLRAHAGQYEGSQKTDERLRGPRWEAVKEVWGAFDAFGEGDEKYSAAFGRDIVSSIPAGSVYFGGTDPGRFLVTAMCKSQVKGDPFFVLTQNALADGTYLEYARKMYGAQLRLPDEIAAKKCFEDYLADAGNRLEAHELKPGENVYRNGSGQVQVSGQVAVMNINGLLAKYIFDKNPDREFYIEESFPLDWMYPQLEPHGLIFKIDRTPMAALPDSVVKADHDYWAQYVAPIIGDWLKDGTSVKEVADFATKRFGHGDFSGFQGDRRFIENAYSHKMFSKLRSSAGGLYAWRAEHAQDAADKERMVAEADYAYRQAWALCPYSPEAVFRYANFLMNQNRPEDALVVVETAAQMPQSLDKAQLSQLVEQIRRQKR